MALAAAGEIDVPTVLLAAEPATITGRVVDTAAVPLGGVAVRATAGAVVVSTTTDAVTGDYTLADLPTPATYVVEFVADGYAVQTIAVEVGAGEQRTAVNGSLLGATGALTGVVRDTAGEPLGSARVVVRGDVLLDTLDDRFDLEFEVAGIDTIGGWVWHHVGRTPAVGDVVPAGDDHPEVRVEAMEGRAVTLVSFDHDDGADDADSTDGADGAGA